MTFVLSVIGRDTLWVVADRRLSYDDGRHPDDDAVKIMVLETTDGRGLLAYAGLGATPKGTQPSEWMSAVLRGRGGMTFDQALGALSDAATRELPKHLALLPGGGHFIVVPAFVRGIGARLYTIENVVDRKTGRHWYRYTYHHRPLPGSPSPRIGVAGSGGFYFHRKGGTWRRDLMRLVKAHDRGKVSAHLVADELAKLNYEAHRNVRDGTVGPRCIVAWRRRPEARKDRPAGQHQFYTGVDRDRNCPSIPTISRGADMQALVDIFMGQFQRKIAEHGVAAGASDFDYGELGRLLAGIPDQPDEKLR
jgi:hypothetical protein